MRIAIETPTMISRFNGRSATVATFVDRFDFVAARASLFDAGLGIG